jgi:hypothetical protein
MEKILPKRMPSTRDALTEQFRELEETLKLSILTSDEVLLV